MSDITTGLLSFLFMVVGPLLGGALGFYIGRKRGSSLPLSVIVGVLGGPCLGTVMVLALPATNASPSGWQGAGRSFGADEDPHLPEKK